MTGTAKFAPVALRVEKRADGTTLLANRLSPPPATATMADRLDHWGRERPDAPFLSEPAEGGRRSVTYREAAETVRERAARLLPLGLSAERPLMVVAANGIDHALLVLAAMRIGLPAAIISPAHCSQPGAPWRKFGRMLGLVTPGLIVADDSDALAGIVRQLGHGDLPVRPLKDLSWLHASAGASQPELEAAAAAVVPDTAAKLLFTSGSTGTPKAVINTHRMLMSNMMALELVWPFLKDKPPVLVDWLPWNHTFGGNCCFNLSLYFGGTMHIDDGKPLPALVGRTVEAIRACGPTVYFNVPAGYDALLPHLERDDDLARQFLSGLDFLFNAAAAMPESTRTRLEAVARRTMGEVPPIVGGWGSTETAPFATVIYFETEDAANIGVPLPGTEIKLVPEGGRTELRVRGPNVMPGYWRQPDATAEAFDSEGFYRIGDAGRLADPERPERGIVFDGRVAENFKLTSGTWVNVGALRLDVIAAASGLIADAVVAGENRDEIGLLLFLNEGACRDLLGEEGAALDRTGLLRHPRVEAEVRARLDRYNARQTGGSTRIGRFRILVDPPSADADETTEKGYLNQRAVLERRRTDVEALYGSSERIAE